MLCVLRAINSCIGYPDCQISEYALWSVDTFGVHYPPHLLICHALDSKPSAPLVCTKCNFYFCLKTELI